MKTRWIAALALFAILLIHGLAGAERTETAVVMRVTDGDTLRVMIGDRAESVRLIGIDTPESRLNRKAKKDAERSGEDIDAIIAMGKRSTEFVKTLIRKGDEVDLEFDVQTRNHYHRLLAYVYLKDGTGRMLNEEIVRAGYGSPMTIPPNVKYRDRFGEAYREAREARRGLWSDANDRASCVTRITEAGKTAFLAVVPEPRGLWSLEED